MAAGGGGGEVLGEMRWVAWALARLTGVYVETAPDQRFPSRGDRRLHAGIPAAG